MKFLIKNVQRYPLKKKMKEGGFTISSLSKALKIDRTHLSRLASEKIVATEKTANKIIKFFDK